MPVSVRRDLPWCLALVVLLSVFNLFWVSPYIGWYDEGEMTGATYCLGISHPCGQALFHLLGKIFAGFPLGPPAFRLGAMSALCSATASGLFFGLSLKLARRSGNEPDLLLKVWLLLLTLAWSLSLPWWRYSLTPLVYALHLLLAFLLLWALSLERKHKWLLAFFILGLAGSFRPTQYFCSPFVLGLWWMDVRRTKNNGGGDWIKTVSSGTVSFLIGWSTALYLPLRSALHPAIAYGDLTHWDAFFRHLLALKFSAYVGQGAQGHGLSLAGQMGLRYWKEVMPVGVGLVLAGLVHWGKHVSRIPIFLGVALGWGMVEALFVLTIPYPTVESHQFLLGWSFSGLLASAPLSYLSSWAFRDKGRQISVTLVLILWVVAQGFSLGKIKAQKEERGAQDYARDVLQIMGPGSVYYPAEENEYFPLAGYQQAFHERMDIRLLEPGTAPDLIKPQVQACLSQGRPLYVTRQWPLPSGWTYQPWGPLYRVVPARGEMSSTRIDPAVQPLAVWGGLELSEFATTSRIQAGGVLSLDYSWTRRKDSPADKTRELVVLFTDDHGNYWMRDGRLWMNDTHAVTSGSFKTMRSDRSYWDQRLLFVPSDFPPGNYHVLIGLQSSLVDQEAGRETYDREFYDRNQDQDFDKFEGSGGNGQIRFSTVSTGDLHGSFIPLDRGRIILGDRRFAWVGDVRIEKPDGP